MKKPPLHLRLVVAEAASSPDRQAVTDIFRAQLESAGVIGLFNHLLKAGFTLVHTEPEKPGLKITATKDTRIKDDPLFLTLTLTESETRGLNQPDIHCCTDDIPEGKRLKQLLDVHEQFETWVFRNLPRITRSPDDRGFGPGPGI